MPAGVEGFPHAVEVSVQRAGGRGDGLRLGRAEAERDRNAGFLPKVELRRLNQVAVAGGVVGRAERVRRVELRQPVARGACEAVAYLTEWARGVER